MISSFVRPLRGIVCVSLAGLAGLLRKSQLLRFSPFRCTGFWVLGQFHYLTDPFRYPPGWQDLGSKLPATVQQLLRIPWTYDGGAAGAVYGGASAMAGRNCGCQ